MKKINEHRTGFFTRMLSLLLTIVMFLSDLGLSSFAVESGTAGTDPAAPSEVAEPTPEQSPAEPVQTPAAEPSNPAEALPEDSDGTLPEEFFEKFAEEGTIKDTQINFSGYGTHSLDIYNYLWYKAPDDADELIQSAGRYEISGKNTPEPTDPDTQPADPVPEIFIPDIIIGNHPVESKGNTDPLSFDIPVSLKKLEMNGQMIIKPTGTVDNKNKSSNKVVMTVNDVSILGDLVVEENADLQLILNANLTVENIILGKNSHLALELKNSENNLTVNCDITTPEVDSTTPLEKRSLMEVSGTGKLIINGKFASNGTVNLNGGTIEAKQGISAKKLSLNGTTVDAAGVESAETNTNKITAEDALSMENSTVRNAVLFGYDYDTQVEEIQKKTLNLSGSNNFYNIDAVGCPNKSPYTVKINEINTTTVKSSDKTTFHFDSAVTYNLDGTGINQGNDWCVDYRTHCGSANFNDVNISFCHDKISFKTNDPVLLPVISVDGYEFKGWKPDGTDEIIQQIDKYYGDIALTPVLAAEPVTVKLDRGYDPSEDTNDKDENENLPARETTMDSNVGLQVELPVPTRFGYKFTGWKITGSAKDLPVQTGSSSISYTVDSADCTKDGEGNYVLTEAGNKVVNMVAQWEKRIYNMNLFLGTGIETNNISISVDGGNNFIKINSDEFAQYSTNFNNGDSSKPSFTLEGRNIIFTRIEYEQNISAYLKQFFPALPEGKLPLLRDDTQAENYKTQNFVGWASTKGLVNESTMFYYGENGMLNLSIETPTLASYEESLAKKNANINASWGKMCYGLDLPEKMPDGWTLSYTGEGGKGYTINSGDKAGLIMVQEETVVTLTTSAVSPKNFSLWGFMKGTEGDTKTRKIIPVEQPYKSGDSTLYYKFTMPSAYVKATYGGDNIWIDIARSPIVFQKNVAFNNRKLNGFWYADLIDELTPMFKVDENRLYGTDLNGNDLQQRKGEDAVTYFYQWDFNDAFRVTSKTVGTQNQLFLVDALTKEVYFREVNMIMRDAYRENALKSLIGDVDCEITNDGPIKDTEIPNFQLTNYANIIIDNKTRQSYTTTLHFINREDTINNKINGNKVGAIMPDTLRPNKNYQNTLKIKGDGKDKSTLELGCAFGNFIHNVNDITINEYIKAGENGSDTPVDEFKYLFHSSNWNCSINNAEINAEHKAIHVGNSNFSFTDSRVDLKSINSYSGATMLRSYLRIRDNLLLGYVPLSLKENSKVVIDGNLEMNYQHWSSKGNITDNTDNWLVVKGNRCDLTNFNWTSGTLICNALIFGRCGGISGGTVITNQILSQPVGFWQYDNKTHSYNHAAENGQTEKATDNEDNYPFLVYSQKRDGVDTYTFSGGKTYLLGHYKLTEDKKFDPNVTAMDEDNPVKQFMLEVIDPVSSDLKDSPSVNAANVQKAVEDAKSNSNYNSNECVVLGNSTYNTGTRSRTIEISGGEIYAAGNITFFNDTNVTGGSVYCNGSFGTKGDLTIKGSNNITAATVGNAYNLTTTMADGTLRWKRTDIQSGSTINADRIGAFERKVSDKGTEPPDSTNKPMSTVTIAADATINKNPNIHHDVYINYIYGSNSVKEENKDSTNPNNLCFKVKWNNSSNFGNQSWSNDALSFAPPKIGENDEKWKWDSLTGLDVDAISAVGKPQNNSADIDAKNAFDRIQMKLYAVKTTYDLVFMKGADRVLTVTSSKDGTVNKPNNDEDKRTVTTDSMIEITLDQTEITDLATNYTVLWYIDGTGIIHNMKPSKEGNKLTFKMPSADVEIYAAKEITLDLDNASYTLLEDGFWTEYGSTASRDDYQFHYWGNLVIKQGSIEEIEYSLTKDKPFTKINNKTIYDNEGVVLGSEKEATRHNILVKADFNNIDKSTENNAKDRTVTLEKIFQTGDSTSIGINIENGAKANFGLNGPVRICRVQVPEQAEFSLEGKNGAGTDAFDPFVLGQEGSNNHASLGYYYGKAGDISLKNLTILGINNGMSGKFCYGKDKGENTVRFEGCEYQTSKHWYSGSNFACNAKDVIFNNSKFTINRAENWPSPFFEECTNVKIINNSDIKVSNSGSSSAATRPFYYGITGSLEITDANLELSMREPTDDKCQMFQNLKKIAPIITLNGSAHLTLDQHASLKKLVMNDNSTVTVGKTTDDGKATGYLLCPDIVANGGTLNAGGIIVSGFYDAGSHGKDDGSDELQKEENFTDAMGKNQYILNGIYDGGMVVNGGTVNASEFITGDVNGKVTVKGGTVAAPVIGTTGKLYGYTRYVPKAGEKYIYTYDRIPPMATDGMSTTTINIDGGEVKILDDNANPDNPSYLGGMRAVVNVSGGKVTLEKNAILGLPENQKTILVNDATAHKKKPDEYGDFCTLNVTGGRVEGELGELNSDGKATEGGSISLPYGKINVSGEDAGINVFDMKADCGNITIDGASGKIYENPFKSDIIEGQNMLAIVVNNKLAAQNLTITNGSVVYADYAYAEVPAEKNGGLTVSISKDDTDKRAYLYAGTAYGVTGAGNGEKDYDDESTSDSENVLGTKLVNVKYVLHPGVEDSNGNIIVKDSDGKEIKDVFLPSDIGEETNHNMDDEGGLPDYIVKTDEDPYKLQDAHCDGYKFLGWYIYDAKENKLGEHVKEIDKSIEPENQELWLGAKWERVKVTFEVQIKIETSEFNSDTMELIEEYKDDNGKPTGEALYKFKRPIEKIEYGEKIFAGGKDGYLPNIFQTVTYAAQAFDYGNEVTGITESDKNVVTVGMANAYTDSDNGSKPLILTVASYSHIRALITLDLNRKEKNNTDRPRDPNFNLSEDTEHQINLTKDEYWVNAYAPSESKLSDIKPFVEKVDENKYELIKPTAPGYTFGGWYTKTGEQVNADKGVGALDEAKTTTLYAKWTPNTYLVRFSAMTEDEAESGTSPDDKTRRWVTVDETEPGIEASGVSNLDYYWVYDSAPNESTADKKTFQTVDGEQHNTLPSAWREGYVFEGWKFNYTDQDGLQKVQMIKDESELNEYVMNVGVGEPRLDVNNYKEKGEAFDPNTPALTLYASYHKVKVTYDLDGGKWTKAEQQNTEEPKYGAALVGYHQVDPGITADSYEKLGEDSGLVWDGTSAHEKNYFVISTTGKYFEENSQKYVKDDYREDLSRKGYTFYGWKEKVTAGEETEPAPGEGTEPKPAPGEGKHYGYGPRFKDLNLKADWVGNSYDLKVHLKDEDYTKYQANFFNKNTDKYPQNVFTIPNVKVGEPISADNWPQRTEWFACNPGKENVNEMQRLLLGATFVGLDPGLSGSNGSEGPETEPDETYLKYADAVTNMLNSKTVFKKGDTFLLPESEAYKDDLADAVRTKDTVDIMSTVPDYPTGTEIDMYGVYRERSLVFIQEYVDINGTAQSKIMYTHPWNIYTDYPSTTYKKDQTHLDLEKGGYSLVGWYVNSSHIDPALQYTKDNYDEKIDEWKKAAEINQTYDINVYTAYLAQTKIKHTLTANGDPTAEKRPATQNYTLPDSFQAGRLSYEIIWPKDEQGNQKGEKLNLVDKEVMQAHLYDSEWTDGTKTYSADNTAAIELKLKSNDDERNKFLIDNSEPNELDTQFIGSGWGLTLTLYHSNVMTKKTLFTFTIKYTFDNSSENKTNDLEKQWLEQEVTVELVPSMYDVTYQVTLPEPNLKPKESKEFTKVEGDEKLYSRTIKQPYGSDMLSIDDTMKLDGYYRENDWKYDYSKAGADTKKTTILGKLALDDIFKPDDADKYFENDEEAKAAKVAELEDGEIKVYTGYVPYGCTLTREMVPDWVWKITYSDGSDYSETTELKGKSDEINSVKDVKYRSKVTLEHNKGTPDLQLTITHNVDGNVKTDSLKNLTEGSSDNKFIKISKEDDGSYTFYMPLGEVIISSLWGLYLDYGTIELAPDGFRQEEKYGDNKIPWEGGYRIWQCVHNNLNCTVDDHEYQVENTKFHSTKNVLQLYGDLTKRGDVVIPKGVEGDELKKYQDVSERKILLGRLNISSNDSIELMDNEKYKDMYNGTDAAAAKLTQEGKILAKNILVPDKTSLTLTGPYSTTSAQDDGNQEGETNADQQGQDTQAENAIDTTVTLTPNIDGTEPQDGKPANVPDRAAIGAILGTPEQGSNGNITLDHVDVLITLKAPSDVNGAGVSGIGPGVQNSTKASEPDPYGNVTVTSSRITVTENGSVSTPKTRAWIGGAGVPNVNISDTTLLRGTGDDIQGAYAVDGEIVNLTNCYVGTEENKIKAPIHANGNLNIKNCQVYQ